MRFDQVKVFHALGDATRMRIVMLLASRDRPVMELVKQFRMSQPAVTKHLNVLEKAGLVSRHKQGRVRLCKLKTAPLSSSRDWLDACRALWTDRLDSLESFLSKKSLERPTDDKHPRTRHD